MCEQVLRWAWPGHRSRGSSCWWKTSGVRDHYGRRAMTAERGVVERLSAVPLYQQLVEILREEIVTGRLEADRRVATEHELMKRFGVSRTTVRETIARLRKEGLISVRQGKGTFVGQSRIEPELSALTGFVEDMQALGLTASAKVLGVRDVKASEHVAGNLSVSPGTIVTKVTRIRLAESVPVSFE